MINCPIDEILLCQGCRYNSDEKCWWYFPARPLKEILTVEERLDAGVGSAVYPNVYPRYVIPSKVLFAKLFDRVEQLENANKFGRQKHSEMMLELDKLQKKKQKPKPKYD